MEKSHVLAKWTRRGKTAGRSGSNSAGQGSPGSLFFVRSPLAVASPGRPCPRQRRIVASLPQLATVLVNLIPRSGFDWGGIEADELADCRFGRVEACSASPRGADRADRPGKSGDVKMGRLKLLHSNVRANVRVKINHESSASHPSLLAVSPGIGRHHVPLPAVLACR